MYKDYRFELLKFLKTDYPNKVNISPFFLKTLQETKFKRPYFMDILRMLREEKFISYSDVDLDGIIVSHGGIYNDKVLMVSLTHNGLDEIARIEKQNYDLKNAERVYKTYCLTKSLSIAGFIISLVLALLKIAEVLKWLPSKC